MRDRIELQWPVLNSGFTYVDNIRDAKHQGVDVLTYYSQQYPHSGTLSEWTWRLSSGQILLNDAVANSSSTLKKGDQLQYRRPPWREPDCPNYINVLYEDEHLIVAAKPAGLQVLPGPVFCQRTALALLGHHRTCPDLPSGRPVPVHRLGRGTSGVLLCACTKAAASRLSQDFAQSSLPDPTEAARKLLHKQYRALVSGSPAADQGTVTASIGRVPHPSVPSGLFAASPQGKAATSHWRVLHRAGPEGPTVVEVDILTGRPHQIRIHMAHMGHPLLGDPLYGPGGIPKLPPAQQGEGPDVAGGGAYQDAEAATPGDCGYLLHSFRLAFHHPANGKQLVLVAPPPPELQAPGKDWSQHPDDCLGAG